MQAGTHPGYLDIFHKANMTLEQIQKELEDYLSMKRMAFPRFYFLSNDELLEILAQTKNVRAVQPHLSKCFDGIKCLDFGSDPNSINILAMMSAEGERVPLGNNLKVRTQQQGTSMVSHGTRTSGIPVSHCKNDPMVSGPGAKAPSFLSPFFLFLSWMVTHPFLLPSACRVLPLHHTSWANCGGMHWETVSPSRQCGTDGCAYKERLVHRLHRGDPCSNRYLTMCWVFLLYVSSSRPFFIKAAA